MPFHPLMIRGTSMEFSSLNRENKIFKFEINRSVSTYDHSIVYDASSDMLLHGMWHYAKISEFSRTRKYTHSGNRHKLVNSRMWKCKRTCQKLIGGFTHYRVYFHMQKYTPKHVFHMWKYKQKCVFHMWKYTRTHVLPHDTKLLLIFIHVCRDKNGPVNSLA